MFIYTNHEKVIESLVIDRNGVPQLHVHFTRRYNARNIWMSVRVVIVNECDDVTGVQKDVVAN